MAEKAGSHTGKQAADLCATQGNLQSTSKPRSTG